MKKILFAIVLVMTMALSVNAQRGSDSFFSYDNGFEDRMGDPNGLLGLPGDNIGSPTNESAPLGSGLLVLTALGAGYAVARKKRS